MQMTEGKPYDIYVHLKVSLDLPVYPPKATVCLECVDAIFQLASDAV